MISEFTIVTATHANKKSIYSRGQYSSLFVSISKLDTHLSCNLSFSITNFGNTTLLLTFPVRLATRQL